MQSRSIRSAFLFIIMSGPFLSAYAGVNKHTKQFGDFTVHYNTLPTDFLSPTVAKQYKVVRSRNRILLNIAIKRKDNSNKMTAVPATIKVMASNLTGQLKYAKMRKVHDGKAIYYIGEFSVANREALNFTVTITPDIKQASTYTLKFRKKFMTR